jgi:hypothetical protein
MSLVNRFPRFLGRPIQDEIALNYNDLEEYINKYANYCDLYMSVYSFPSPIDKNSAIIDKVFFDFDDNTIIEFREKNIPKCLRDVLVLHEDLEKDNIKHIINISGRGFHVFLFTEECDLSSKSDTIFNIQDYYQNKLDLNLDEKIKGDIRRIFRMPNTFNFKAFRMCVSLNKDVLCSDIDAIYEYAKTPRPLYYFCDNLLDIKRFDKKREYSNNFNCKLVNVNERNFENTSELLKEIYSNAPDCIKYLIDLKNINYNQRYFLMLYLKETKINNLFLGLQDIMALMQEILTEEKWLHFSSNNKDSRGVEGEGFRPLYTIMQKNYYMPDCNKVKNEIKACFSETTCKRKHPKYDY